MNAIHWIVSIALEPNIAEVAVRKKRRVELRQIDTKAVKQCSITDAQCTTVGFWESLASPVSNRGNPGDLDEWHFEAMQNTSSGHLHGVGGQYDHDQLLRLAGLRCFFLLQKKYLDHEKPFHCSPDDWRDVYYTLYNCEIFVFPLAIIIATHLKIYILLKRWLTLLSYGKYLFNVKMGKMGDGNISPIMKVWNKGD